MLQRVYQIVYSNLSSIFVFRSELSDIRINCNRTIDGLLHFRDFWDNGLIFYIPSGISKLKNDNTNSKPHEQPSSPLF
jgi:hypothetical protein